MVKPMYNIKYPNKIVVTVTNKPFGKSYVLFVCNIEHIEKMKEN